MAYRAEQNGDIVIDGFENGIADSPYQGITDIRNMNLISVPGEASVNYSTSNVGWNTAITGTIASSSGTTGTFTGGASIENYVAVYFTGVGTVSNATLATPYWVKDLSGSTFALTTDYAQTTCLDFAGGTGATFVAYQMGIKPSYATAASNGPIQHFAQPKNILSSSYFTFGVDKPGMVWSNQHTTTSGYWTYTGNRLVNSSNISNTNGAGLVYWRVSNGAASSSITTADYLFVIRNAQIDYYVVQSTASLGLTEQTWFSGWNPATASVGASNYLTVVPGYSGSHEAIESFDGRVYFCDGNNIQKLYQTAPTTIFNPSSGASYTYTTYNLLPIDDNSTCIAPFGTNILIGGEGNVVYQWDTTSNLVSNYIPIAESFTSKIVTVNTNSYIFAGGRGRIYTTNGAQANLWRKIPDHMTNTIEPVYKWGGAYAMKNQLYFSFRAVDSANTALAVLGGVWATDLDTKALRLANKLSYGTYNGYASAIMQQTYDPDSGITPRPLQAGTSLFIGWDSGASTYGLDVGTMNPYTGGQASITSDMIPIGTLLKPTTSSQLEYKLTTPLLAGETIQLLMSNTLASNTDPTFTSVGTTIGDGTQLSDNFPVQLQNQQWMMVKAVSTGTTGTKSFVRLREMRIIK
jgi:hypothetical protein